MCPPRAELQPEHTYTKSQLYQDDHCNADIASGLRLCMPSPLRHGACAPLLHVFRCGSGAEEVRYLVGRSRHVEVVPDVCPSRLQRSVLLRRHYAVPTQIQCQVPLAVCHWRGRSFQDIQLHPASPPAEPGEPSSGMLTMLIPVLPNTKQNQINSCATLPAVRGAYKSASHQLALCIDRTV